MFVKKVDALMKLGKVKAEKKKVWTLGQFSDSFSNIFGSSRPYNLAMPVFTGNLSGVSFYPSRIGRYTLSSSSIQRVALGTRCHEYGGLGHIRRYCTNLFFVD